MKLYEIASHLSTAIDQYNQSETDEQLAEMEGVLNGLQISFDEKCLAVAHHVLNVESDLPGIEAEIERLATIKKRVERQAEWFRGYLKRNMEAIGTKQIDGATVTLKIKNNPAAVIVEDESLVPATYTKTKMVVSIDKNAIKKSWDNGVGVSGTSVSRGTRLEIK